MSSITLVTHYAVLERKVAEQPGMEVWMVYLDGREAEAVVYPGAGGAGDERGSGVVEHHRGGAGAGHRGAAYRHRARGDRRAGDAGGGAARGRAYPQAALYSAAVSRARRGGGGESVP